MTESPALVLKENLAELAHEVHDALMDAGCNCPYVVTASWERSSYPQPVSQVRHAPECAMNFLPPGGEENAPPASEPAQHPPPAKRAAKKSAAKPKPVPAEDEGDQRPDDRQPPQSG